MMTRLHVLGTLMLTVLMITGCTDQTAAQRDVNSAQTVRGEDKSAQVPSPRSVNDVKAARDLKVGRSVFTKKCLACHGEGAQGAPKLGDVAAWADRVEQDLDILIQHAINGHGRMPPKGGFADLSNAQVASAVAYIVNKSQRLIKAANLRKRATKCHPINNPALCTEEELRDALTLHMMWLLRSNEGGS